VPIPGAPETVAWLRDQGCKLIFCTNNARYTQEEYVAKLGRVGVVAVTEELVTSALVTAETLAARGCSGRRAVVIGGPGLHEALRSVDIAIVEDDQIADMAVVGADPELTYEMLRLASNAARRTGRLYATNPDATFPAPTGLTPGAGAIVAAVEVASGVTAEVMGKPHRPIMEAAARRLEGCERIAVIGDQPATDLDGARLMGWDRILVLSGVTGANDPIITKDPPDLVLPSLAELATNWDRG
jgi:4-nitrophenyl phosphatase